MIRLSLLRGVAILIALAAFIDPAWTGTTAPARELVAIDLTDGASDRVVAALEASAPAWHVVRRRADDNRLPCGTHERCVVIADGSRDATIPVDVGPIHVIAVRQGDALNQAVESAVVSAAHATGAGTMRVSLSRTGGVQATELRILDDGAIVGAARHTWGEGQAATIDVPWWPLDAGARTLRVEALPVAGEATTIDNALEVGVTVSAEALGVVVFDARPSWNSTFVRRALEDDPRFTVAHRARVAPGLSAGTPQAALEPSMLERTPLVVVGGPDALTAADVTQLERYVSERGGSLILLPERRVDGPARRLLDGDWSEELVTEPVAIGGLRATEFLRASRLPAAATVLGYAGESPSMVALPRGEGRVIVAGAMDAWRHRGASGFERFWRSLAAESASAGQALRIDLATPLAARGARVPFTVRHRSLDSRAAVEARVSVTCGGNQEWARAWPAGSVHEFSGEFAAGESGQCDVRAAVADRVAVASVAVGEWPLRGARQTLTQLERAARTAGAVVVEAGKEAAIAEALADSTADSSQVVTEYPMRAWWWMLPFAACVSAEWWLRRRAGLR